MPTNKKGGYQIVDIIALTYATALACVECGKPLLVINDEDNTPYFADSIKVDSDNDDAVVIGKGGRTITIEDDGTITKDGSIVVYVHKFNMYNEGDTDFFFEIRSSKKSLTLQDIADYIGIYGSIATYGAIDIGDANLGCVLSINDLNYNTSTEKWEISISIFSTTSGYSTESDDLDNIITDTDDTIIAIL